MEKRGVKFLFCLAAAVLVMVIMIAGSSVSSGFFGLEEKYGEGKEYRSEGFQAESEGNAPGSQVIAKEEETDRGRVPAEEDGDVKDTVPSSESNDNLERGSNPDLEAARSESLPADGESFPVCPSESAGTIPVGGIEDSSIKSDYNLSDYKSNEIIVCYKNGEIRLIHCDYPTDVEKQISMLKQDSSVEFYQPNFDYAADVVQTSFLDESQYPVYYGAEDENSAMAGWIEENASLNIAEKHTSAPEDPFYYLQWALDNRGDFTGVNDMVHPQAGIDIRAEEAWSVYNAKRSVIVALVDTGVDYENADLGEHLWTNGNEIEDNGLDDDGNGYIDDIRGWNFYNNNNRIYIGSEDDHGTHCASSMVSLSNYSGITGIADYSNIRLMSVKALGGKNGGGTTLTVMKAIQYAEQNGASICNLSLGTSVNDRLLYRTMQSSGMLFVVAAGNSASPSENGRDIDLQPCYPASYSLDNILTTANIDAAGNLHHTSNYGSLSVDLAAPGSDILAYSSDGKLAFMTGTSMAAPIVSAAAAMVYTASEDRSLADTALILKKTANRNPALSDCTSTGGIIDLGKAVSWK